MIAMPYQGVCHPQLQETVEQLTIMGTNKLAVFDFQGNIINPDQKTHENYV